MRWDATAAARATDPEQHITALEAQLGAMAQRVESVLATAADLIADENLDTTLARITDRAATAVRAPKYLLAVQTTPEGDLHRHHRGLTDDEADRLATRLKGGDDTPPTGSWRASLRPARLRPPRRAPGDR